MTHLANSSDWRGNLRGLKYTIEIDLRTPMLITAPQTEICPLGKKLGLSITSLVRLESKARSASGRCCQTSVNKWASRFERSLITMLGSFRSQARANTIKRENGRPAVGWQVARLVKSGQPSPPLIRWVGSGPRGCS